MNTFIRPEAEQGHTESVGGHTPEPWFCNHQGWCSNTELFENQRRIVACVNACRLLDTNLLERIIKNGGQGIHPNPQERIEELEAQCAALLYVLGVPAEQGEAK